MRNRRRYRPRAVETTFSARDAETLATAAKFSTMNTRRTLRIFDRAISSSGERTIVRSERVLSVSLVVHFSAIHSNRFLEWRIRRTFYIFLPLDWHSVENAIDLAILIIIDIRSLLYRDRIISAIKRNRIVYTPRIRTNMNKWIEMVKHDSQFHLPSVENNFFFRFEPRNTLYQDYTVPIFTYARISHKGEINGEWRHFYRRSRSRCMRKVGRRNCSIN